MADRDKERLERQFRRFKRRLPHSISRFMQWLSEPSSRWVRIPLAIIIGSTRPNRVGEAVGRWVYELARKRRDAEYELVDIKAFNLPLLDEPIPPSQGKYSKEHTKKWAAKIGSFDGYVFVTARDGRQTEPV